MRLLKLIEEYQKLNLHSVIDYDKFNHYSITHHSTVIEGSTLTEEETTVLLDEGITPKGKPLDHSLMVKDHYNALKFVLEAATKKTPVTIDFIQQVSAIVMKGTGSFVNSALGTIDQTKGEFRKSNVSAGSSYFMTYDKEPGATQKFVQQLAEDIQRATTIEEKLELSFFAHFDLVSIHPFYDGNGRVSRLIMTYLQAYFNLPPGIVFKEDKAEYIAALNESREVESKQPFYDFMIKQYEKYLTGEIRKYKQMQQEPEVKKGKGFGLFF